MFQIRVRQGHIKLLRHFKFYFSKTQIISTAVRSLQTAAYHQSHQQKSLKICLVKKEIFSAVHGVAITEEQYIMQKHQKGFLSTLLSLEVL